MNKVIMMGRLTKDPEARVTAGEKATTVSQFSIAVDRRFDREHADFFEWTAWGKLAEFVEKYLTKGTKILCTGRVENNNYTRKDGVKVYGFRYIAEEIEFAESKGKQETKGEAGDSGFMAIPDNVDDDGLPFN